MNRNLRNRRARQAARSATQMDGLVVSGLTELALGALTGWPMAIRVSRPRDLPKLGIRSRARLRQWHLDLIMLARSRPRHRSSSRQR